MVSEILESGDGKYRIDGNLFLVTCEKQGIPTCIIYRKRGRVSAHDIDKVTRCVQSHGYRLREIHQEGGIAWSAYQKT
jgi:hypothetical protein